MYRLSDTALEDALFSDTPSVYLSANKDRYSELAALIGVKQSAKHHAEGDAFVHTLMVTDEAAKLRDIVSEPLGFMLSALCHDMGKAVCTTETDGVIHALGHETQGLPIVSEFLSRIGADDDIRRYVLNMTELHMEPNIMAAAGSRLKKTNRLFYRAAAPYDLIQLAVCDGIGKIPPVSYEDFLIKRYEEYTKIMARPYVTAEDIADAGIPQEKAEEALCYAHKLRLAGIDKESALRQTTAQFMKRKNG